VVKYKGGYAKRLPAKRNACKLGRYTGFSITGQKDN